MLKKNLFLLALALMFALVAGCSEEIGNVINSESEDQPGSKYVGISADSINALGRAAMMQNGGKTANQNIALGWQLYVHVPFYSQKDPSWSWCPLGWSNLKIGDYGCHITCVAMLYAKWGHGNMNPNCVSTWGRHHGGFNGPNAIAGKIIDYGGNRNARNISAGQIYSELAAGHPVIVEIPYGDDGSHFMIIYAFDGSRYWVKDPIRDWRSQSCPLYGSSIKSVRVYGY